MGGFATLFLGPSDSPAPWKIVVKRLPRQRRYAPSPRRVEIRDAQDMFVAEAATVAIAEAIVWAVNHCAENQP